MELKYKVEDPTGLSGWHPKCRPERSYQWFGHECTVCDGQHDLERRNIILAQNTFTFLVRISEEITYKLGQIQEGII